MKMLSSDTTRLLDKLYNLRGEDSVMLASMEKERQEAEATRDKTTKQKTELQDKIGSLTAEETVLADEGEKLTRALATIRKSEFATVIEHLHIEFDPEAIKRKVENTLPLTLEKVANEKKKAGEELVKVEDEMNEAITKIEELGIRKDEALKNQERLNNYFDLALSSNINITRDEITGLLSNFEFSDEEQREAAKLLMFPEDGLFLYDKAFKGKTSGENIADISDEDGEEDPAIELTENEEAKEDETITLKEAEAKENKKSNDAADVSKDELANFLTDLGFDYLDFTANDFTKMKENFDKEIFANNIKVVDSIGINKDIFVDNIELFFDKELEAKIELLTKVGKQPQDIYLNPNVLVKYNLEELNTAIKMLQESGLEPKNVPLMAY